MNKDDSFASPDSDRTIIIPSPGGRVPPSAQSANHWQTNKPKEAITGIDATTVASGLNLLIAAANPLLNIVPQLRATLQHTDLLELRDYIAQHIKTFESRAKAAGVSPEKTIAARYSLCTLLDETVSSTPWGSGVWGKHNLLVMFHNETSGGEKFFKLLSKLAENPKANLDLLEFMNICLVLGFEGRYRVMDNGKAHLYALHEQLVQLLKKEHGEYERDLSPHWQAALHKPEKIFLLLPLWVLSALCGLILLTTYLGFDYLLNSASDPVFGKIQSIHIKNPAPKYVSLQQLPEVPVLSEQPKEVPVLSEQPKEVPVLSEFLNKEIQEGLVTVRDDNGYSVVITLLGDSVFESGSTAVSQNFVLILARIADELKTVPGQIQITGHTDNRPIRSLRFPSNWHLSQERARSVMQLIIKMGIPASRLSAEGQADVEPIASNSTPEGRARNRRVEIILAALHASK